MAHLSRRESEETAAGTAAHSVHGSDAGSSKAQDVDYTKEKEHEKGTSVVGSIAPEETPQYPTGIPLFLIAFALVLTVFTVSLDQTIIASPLPCITDEFNARL